MTRRLFHILAATALAALLALFASGCSSRKATAMRGSDGYRKGGGRNEATTKPPRDYSYEVPDAMSLDLVGEARQWLGTPYRYGGTSYSGIDCSGFTMKVFAQFGISLPHGASDQYALCTPVTTAERAPGDLVFFNTSGRGIGHVGIYLGGGQFIHASTSRGVVISSLYESYYANTYLYAGRIISG